MSTVNSKSEVDTATLRLEGPSTQGGAPSLQALARIASALADISLRAMRYEVEGRSDLRGVPSWLREASEIRLTHVQPGSILLLLEAPRFVTLRDVILPTRRKDQRTPSSCLSVLRDTLHKASIASLWPDLDDQVVRSVLGLLELTRSGIERMTLQNAEPPVQLALRNLEHLRLARSPEPELLYVRGAIAGTPIVREPIAGSIGQTTQTSLAAPTPTENPAEAWLKGARQDLHTVAPLIEEDARGIAYVRGTTTKVTEVVLNKAWTGRTPEALQTDMSHLSLAQIYAALAHYYANQVKCDKQIEQAREFADRLRAEGGPSPIAARLRAAGKLR